MGNATTSSTQLAGVPDLRVDAPPEMAAFADRVRSLDPVVIHRIMSLVGVRDAGAPITIVLATEDTEVAGQTPRAIAGFARSAESLVVLFPARSISYPYDSFDDVVRHELAHVFIGRAAGEGRVPRWFHEGLALLAERAWGLEDRTRVAFALTGTRWSPRELDAAFQEGGRRTADAYAIAGALVRDVMRRSGEDGPARILARMAGGEPFDTAFSRVTGESVRLAHERFWRSSWWSEMVPFVTSSLVLWLFVVLLGLLAFRTRRARNAERRRRWQEEDDALNRPAVEQGASEIPGRSPGVPPPPRD